MELDWTVLTCWIGGIKADEGLLWVFRKATCEPARKAKKLRENQILGIIKFKEQLRGKDNGDSEKKNFGMGTHKKLRDDMD
jgi:hypothetical protein